MDDALLDHYAARIAAAARQAMEQLVDDDMPVEAIEILVATFEAEFAANFRQAFYCD